MRLLESPTGGNGAGQAEGDRAGMTEDDQLREKLERLFPNPKTIDKTRKRLFEIVKLKRTYPNLTIEQLAGQLVVGGEVVGEEIVKRNLRKLRDNNLF